MTNNIKQLQLYRNYYETQFRNNSVLPNEVDYIIMDYVMDFHYLEYKRKLVNEFKKNKVIYINYLTNVEGIWRHLQPKPTWMPLKKIKSLSNFLRSMLYEVHGRTGWKFYQADLELMGSLMDRVNYIIFDTYAVKFDVAGGIQVILHYDIYNGLFATDDLDNKLKFLVQYK